MENIRVCKGHTRTYENDQLIKVTEEVIDILVKKKLTVGEAEAILKDAIDTINSISKEVKL